MHSNPHIGETFDNCLAKQGTLEACEEIAIKQLLADQVADLMKQKQLSKTVMAKRMNTSRSTLDRLLDPDNQSVTLNTLQRAASAVGRRLHVELR